LFERVTTLRDYMSWVGRTDLTEKIASKARLA
jgi:hypothetical protein